MEISQEGITLIKHYEGCPQSNGKAVSYRCAANKATIGYGSLKLIDGSPVKDDMSITMEEAEELLTHELKEYQGYINDMVTVPLKQNEFDSLVSWVFNLGPSNLKSSTFMGKAARSFCFFFFLRLFSIAIAAILIGLGPALKRPSFLLSFFILAFCFS